MELIRAANDRDLEAIAGWLAEPRIARWLDLGTGRGLDARALKVAVARGTERPFAFSADGAARPIGVVSLSQIHPAFHTGMLWYALGDPGYGGRGLTTRAVRAALEIGFRDLGLEAVNAWAVEGNKPSRRVLEKTGFTLIGRQRRCHWIDGEARDRLLFDLVASDREGA